MLNCDSSTLKIGKNFNVGSILEISISSSYTRITNNQIIIGNNVWIGSAKIGITNISNASCNIGNNCMLSNHIKIKVADAHPIYNSLTKKIVNKSSSIIIGNNVWIGEEARICKNVIIPNNTIIGLASVVTKKFKKENTVIAGIPAKVVSKNKSWKAFDEQYSKNERLK